MRASRQAEPELLPVRLGGNSHCGGMVFLGWIPPRGLPVLSAASSWAGQAAPWGMCAIIPSGSHRDAWLWAHSHPSTLSLPLAGAGTHSPHPWPCWAPLPAGTHPPSGHQTPPRKALPVLSILNSSNPLLIQLLDELEAAPLLASPPEYPIRAVTPWLGAQWPSGPSLIRISEPNSILEVFMARRSWFFGVGWLANRLCSSQWQSLAEELLGRS